MLREEFVQIFGGVYEHSVWIAERTWDLGLSTADDTLDELLRRFSGVVMSAAPDQQLALIRAHPDLAGTAARRGELTSESKGEQSGAGIDQCSEEELEVFGSRCEGARALG